MNCLRGEVKFLTGGNAMLFALLVRARKLIRCDSETDSIVWMREEWLFMPFCARRFSFGFFFWRQI